MDRKQIARTAAAFFAVSISLVPATMLVTAGHAEPCPSDSDWCPTAFPNGGDSGALRLAAMSRRGGGSSSSATARNVTTDPGADASLLDAQAEAAMQSLLAKLAAKYRGEWQSVGWMTDPKGAGILVIARSGDNTATYNSDDGLVRMDGPDFSGHPVFLLYDV